MTECGKNNNRLERESIQADVQAYGASIFEEAWLRVCRQDKRKQWLSAKHRKAHVQWCERCQHWTFQDWRKEIFTDEPTFYVLKRKTKSKFGEQTMSGCYQVASNK